MAAPVIGTRPRYAPRAGAMIDQSHALSSGLEFCIVPGAGMRDLVKGYAATVGGTPSLGLTGFGPALTCSTTSDKLTYSGVPDSGFLGPMSVLWVGRLNQTTGYSSIAGKYAGAGLTNDPFTFYVAYSNSTLAIGRGNATTVNTWSSPTLTSFTAVNSYHTVVAAMPGLLQSNATFWIDNVTYTIAPSGGQTGSITGSSAALVIGAINAAATLNSTNIFAVWSRMLSAAEATALYADPFCFLRY